MTLLRSEPLGAKHVFLSYSRTNARAVKGLHDDLTAAGEVVWWDRDILGGKDWQLAIHEAMTASYAVVLCLSKQTEQLVTSGIYPEALAALEAYRQYRPGETFIIPVRLSRCAIPAIQISGMKMLGNLQYVDLFPKSRRTTGIRELIDALRAIPGHP